MLHRNPILKRTWRFGGQLLLLAVSIGWQGCGEDGRGGQTPSGDDASFLADAQFPGATTEADGGNSQPSDAGRDVMGTGGAGGAAMDAGEAASADAGVAGDARGGLMDASETGIDTGVGDAAAPPDSACAADADACSDLPDGCVNADGAIECGCPAGYNAGNDGGCSDDDECALGITTCDAALRCVNVPGSSGCSRPVRQVVMNGQCSCALLDTGEVKCWGYNYSGCLGVGASATIGDQLDELGANLPVVDLGTGRTARVIEASTGAVCALLDNDALKCWGYNLDGELGIGNSRNRGDDANEMGDNLPAVDLGSGRTAKAVYGGGKHVCARLDDDTVKCWGANYYGQLGLGDSENRGDGPNEMGDDLPVVDLGTDRIAKTMAVGGGHACALLDNDTVKCWGRNEDGQLGVGDSENRGDHADEMGDDLPVVDLGTGRTAKALCAGTYHTCALLDSGDVTCWGQPMYGKLGLSEHVQRGDDPDEMGDNLPLVDLGTGRTAKAIACSRAQHTCALLDNDRVKCWGYNNSGQLGLGDTRYRGDAVNHMGDTLPFVELGPIPAMAIATGGGRVCALLQNDTVKCWGNNDYGELGVGDRENRGDDPNEMGALLPAVLLGP